MNDVEGRSRAQGRGVAGGPGLLAAAASLALVLTPASALAAADDVEATSLVATTEVLGAVVAELAGDVAEVQVLMPSGADPHAWEPSARDAERLLEADLVVANGLDLEEGLQPVLDVVRSEGVPIFEAAAHVDLRELGAAHEDEDAAHEDDDEHDHGVADPHIWTDPLAMRDVVGALADELRRLGVDVSDQSAATIAGLESLDAEVRLILDGVASEQRKLVTGHESMGYFADRYGFELVGTVIPGLTTDGEPSARELSELIAEVREAGVRVVFSEVGTPPAVARAVADDSGARLVELSTSQLPEGGGYDDLIRAMASDIAVALTE